MQTNAQKLESLVASLAIDLESTVRDIESESLPTTRNHYGRYMNLLIALSRSDITAAAVIKLALIKAGANPRGVNDAFHAAFGR